MTHSRNIYSTEAGLRDYVLISLMVRCGLRDTEVARANVGDITKKGKTHVLMLHGKGRTGKDDYVALTPSAHKHIELYLAERGELGRGAPHCFFGF